MNTKVLCVDDEENVLRGFERNLRLNFELDTAVGPIEGLTAVGQRGPYAVVVSDLRMPEMDGIQFLSAVRKVSPDSVRMILSGNADLQAVIASVNEGSIFRFLTKPCPADILRSAIEAGLRQYQLITAERELLEVTLNGSIGMMTEVLSVVSPLAFSRASRIRRYVRHMATQVQLPNLWEFDLAAMLSQLGCIAVPSDILEKFYAGIALTTDEQQTFSSHPSIAHKLLARIPRIEVVAEIIRYQLTPFHALSEAKSVDVATGAQMLMIATRFDEALSAGTPPASALQFMRDRPKTYRTNLVAAMESVDVGDIEMEVRALRIQDLRPRMVINRDIRAANGIMLVAKGQIVSDSIIAILLNFSKSIGIEGSISVQVPVSRPMVADLSAMSASARFAAK